MFTIFQVQSTNVLVNLSQVLKVLPRPKPRETNPPKDLWEVVVFYSDTRQLHPITGIPVWTGTYDVIHEGTQSDCEDFADTLYTEIKSSH